MRTESTILRTINSLINCDHVSCKKICKGSYKSGDLRVTGTLTACVGGTNFMASSAGRSIRDSLISGSGSGSSTTVDSASGLAALSDSGSGSNSATTSNPVSSRTSGSTRIGRYGSPQERRARQGLEDLDLYPSLQFGLLQVSLEPPKV